MAVFWLSQAEVLDQVGLTAADLRWYEAVFQEQMRFLRKDEGDGLIRYDADAVALLRGLSSMVAQGATPEQIKAWFGLAASRQ